MHSVGLVHCVLTRESIIPLSLPPPSPSPANTHTRHSPPYPLLPASSNSPTSASPGSPTPHNPFTRTRCGSERPTSPWNSSPPDAPMTATIPARLTPGLGRRPPCRVCPPVAVWGCTPRRESAGGGWSGSLEGEYVWPQLEPEPERSGNEWKRAGSARCQGARRMVGKRLVRNPVNRAMVCSLWADQWMGSELYMPTARYTP